MTADDGAGAAGPGALRSPSPRWVTPIFGLLALALVPWTVWLGLNLPDRTVSENWNLAWVGFDVALFLALAGTAWAGHRRSSWVVATATAAATLLVIDAWFDITTSRTGGELAVALAQAAIVELPLALTCLWIARNGERANRRAVIHLPDTDAARSRRSPEAGAGYRPSANQPTTAA